MMMSAAALAVAGFLAPGGRDVAPLRVALVQGGGYVVASTGPAVIGAVHEATGTWSVPLLVILTATVLFCIATTVSATRRTAARA